MTMMKENEELFKQVNDDIMEGLEEFTTRAEATKTRVSKGSKFNGITDVAVDVVAVTILLLAACVLTGLI